MTSLFHLLAVSPHVCITIPIHHYASPYHFSQSLPLPITTRLLTISPHRRLRALYSPPAHQWQGTPTPHLLTSGSVPLLPTRSPVAGCS